MAQHPAEARTDDLPLYRREAMTLLDAAENAARSIDAKIHYYGVHHLALIPMT